MADNVVFLANGSVSRDEPDQDLVEFLEGVLAKAKSGEAQDVVMVWREGSGDNATTLRRWAPMTFGGIANTFLAMELCMQEMKDEILSAD